MSIYITRVHWQWQFIVNIRLQFFINNILSLQCSFTKFGPSMFSELHQFSRVITITMAYTLVPFDCTCHGLIWNVISVDLEEIMTQYKCVAGHLLFQLSLITYYICYGQILYIWKIECTHTVGLIHFKDFPSDFPRAGLVNMENNLW